MITKHEAQVKKDLANKTITVVKEVDADIDTVWEAWTDSDQLDKWWAPKPWRAETETMDFKEGGSWLYYMVGPKGERHGSRFDYDEINAPKQFSGTDSFVGGEMGNLPSSEWTVRFSKAGAGTRIEAVLTFDKKEDLEKILETGFEEGFKSGLDNLEELLAK